MTRPPRLRCALVAALALRVALPFGAGASARAQHTHPAPPPADPADPAVAAVVERARAATARYRDHAAAVAAGYRLMGPDMPGMGEHWVHPGLAVARAFDPARPAVLTYLPTDSALVLTGVAYVVPVRPGEASPPAPVPGTAWHFHRADLSQEAFGPPDAAMHDGAAADGYRLAMLHAWVWRENPDGLFAADNWALPYIRAGLPVPARPHPRAARAVSLLTTGVGYYAEAVRHATGADAAALAAVRGVLDTYRARVAALVGAPGGPNAHGLDALWTALWADVAAVLPPDLRPRVVYLAE